MKIGIGLPNPVRGTSGHVLLEMARRAEERGFTGLATIDRIAYPNYDSLAALAAAAGATSRIGLQTNILLGPAYQPILLAKTAASIDQLSGGRLTLGLAPGGRPDDYLATGNDFHTRGRDLDAMVDVLHRAWRGEHVVPGVDQPVCPIPVNNQRVPILFGGGTDRSIERMVASGDGWTTGGGTAQMAAPMFAKARDAWRQAGRDGEPRLAALAYFSLGAEADDASHAYLRDYYEFLGPYAEMVAESALRTPEAIRETASAFVDAGCTELYFDPTVASVDQVDRLADLVL